MPRRIMKPPEQAIHPWRWRALTLWIVLFTAAILFGLIQQRHESQNRAKGLRQADYNACLNNRLLIEKVILRGIGGMTFQQYKKDPIKARKLYTEILKGNSLFRNHPDAVKKTVDQTFDIIKVADPSNCRKVVNK